LDHFTFFKTMPVRRLVMVAFLGLGAALLFVVWGARLFLGAPGNMTGHGTGAASGVDDGGARRAGGVHPLDGLA